MTATSALRAYRHGRATVLLDERPGRPPATLIVAAETIAALTMSFLVRYSSGFVTIGLPDWRCDELDLPAIAADPQYLVRPVAAVSVDAASGVSTGISAADRSHTARLLADPGTGVDALTRPGHLVPLRVPTAIGRPISSAAAAGLQLCELSGRTAGAVCGELVDDAGELLTAAAGRRFAAEHGLVALSRAEVEQLGQAAGSMTLAARIA
jgi:3,4-dihydroxy-2-butanone 4-phosphate synthase